MKKFSLEEALQLGVLAHKEGNIGEADRYYTAILKAQPDHPDANHNLGILALSLDKSEAALPFFKTALKANPNIEQFWLSYINALIKEGQFNDAKKVIEQGRSQGVTSDKLDNLEVQ